MRTAPALGDAPPKTVILDVASAGALLTPPAFVLWSLVLKAALDFGYYTFAVPVYGYTGLVRSFSLDRLLISYGLTVVFALLIARVARTSRPSSVGLVVLFGMMFLPLLTYWSLSGESTEAMFVFGAGFSLTVVTLWPRFPSLATPKIHSIVPLTLATALCCAVFGIIFAHGGREFINFSFAKVYGVRSDVYSQVITGFARYLVPWYGKCAAVLLMCYSAWRRRWLAFAALIAAQIMLFALTSDKEYAFYPLVVLLFLNTRRLPRLGTAIAAAMAVVAAASCALYLIWGNLTVPAILLMRTFIAQARNSFQYFHFFQDNELVGWSNSFLSVFLNYPYDRPIPEIIGFARFGSGQDAFANTGYLGSGFMQLGVAGVIIYGVLAGVMLRLFDLIGGARVPFAFAGSLAFVTATQLVNTDLTVVFLSSGVLLGYILLFMLRTRLERPPVVAVGVGKQPYRG